MEDRANDKIQHEGPTTLNKNEKSEEILVSQTGKDLSDLEVTKFEATLALPVLVSSVVLVLILLIIFQVNEDLFDRLQYEDSYIENLTVLFLAIGFVGLGRRCGRIFGFIRDPKNQAGPHEKLIFAQLLALALVALYGGLQEVEFGQRQLDYEEPESIGKEGGMNLHNIGIVELIISIGAIVIIGYTTLLPYLTRNPWNEKWPASLKTGILPWLLKLPRSLVPAFAAGALFTLVQVVSIVTGPRELEEFNEFAEFFLALGYGLLGGYLFLADKNSPTI